MIVVSPDFIIRMKVRMIERNEVNSADQTILHKANFRLAYHKNDEGNCNRCSCGV